MSVCILSRVQLCHSTHYSLPVPLTMGLSQQEILQWVAVFSSKGSSRPRGRTCISSIGRWMLYHWAIWETQPAFESLSKVSDGSDPLSMASSEYMAFACFIGAVFICIIFLVAPPRYGLHHSLLVVSDWRLQADAIHVASLYLAVLHLGSYLCSLFFLKPLLSLC